MFDRLGCSAAFAFPKSLGGGLGRPLPVPVTPPWADTPLASRSAIASVVGFLMLVSYDYAALFFLQICCLAIGGRGLPGPSLAVSFSLSNDR